MYSGISSEVYVSACRNCPASQECQWRHVLLTKWSGIYNADRINTQVIYRRRIGLIHKWSIDSRKLKWSVHVSALLSNCKQSITSQSLLVGTTVLVVIRRIFYINILKQERGSAKTYEHNLTNEMSGDDRNWCHMCAKLMKIQTFFRRYTSYINFIKYYQNKWVWPRNATITDCRPTDGTMTKRDRRLTATTQLE